MSVFAPPAPSSRSRQRIARVPRISTAGSEGSSRSSRSTEDAPIDRALRAQAVGPTSWPAARVARLGQVVLGLIWLIDGLLQFQPYMFGKTFVTGVIDPNAVGQPGIIASPITWIGHLIEPRVALFNAFAATLQVAIGAGLLYRRTVRPALLVSFVWALGIWFSGEGLGMIFTGNANPLTGAPGAALLYVFAGLLCWPHKQRRGEHRSTIKQVKAYGLIGEHTARRAWAALWLGSAALWLLPANDSASATHEAITAVPSGAGWLTSIINSVAKATAGHGTSIAIVMATLSAAIGVSALRNRLAKPALILAIAISTIFWVIGEGFGGVFTGQATDVNTGPLLILIAVVLYAFHASTREHTATGAQTRPTITHSPGASVKSGTELNRAVFSEAVI